MTLNLKGKRWINIDVDGRPAGRIRADSVAGRQLEAVIDQIQNVRLQGDAYQWPSEYSEETA